MPRVGSGRNAPRRSRSLHGPAGAVYLIERSQVAQVPGSCPRGIGTILARRVTGGAVLPSHLLIGLVLGLALLHRPRLLRLVVVVAGVAWAFALAIVSDTSGSGLDKAAGLLVTGILSVANLGLGALVGLYLHRWIEILPRNSNSRRPSAHLPISGTVAKIP